MGNIIAKFNLGFAYYRGIGVKKDYKKAYAHFKDAAENVHVGAQYHLALFYDKGIIVSKDYKKAVILQI